MVDIGPGGDSIANYGPYRCEVCDYSTDKRTDLNGHMLSDEHVKNVQEFHRSNNVMRANGKIRFTYLIHFQVTLKIDLELSSFSHFRIISFH